MFQVHAVDVINVDSLWYSCSNYVDCIFLLPHKSTCVLDLAALNVDNLIGILSREEVETRITSFPNSICNAFKAP